MRPVGWRYESVRHALAAKGVKTRYQKVFPNLRKAFPGENPRITARYARFRQRRPSDFVEGSLRTLDRGDRKLIIGRLKRGGSGVQSVMLKRRKYWVRRVEKKGKVHVTRSGEDVRRAADEVLHEIEPYVQKAEIVGSIRRRVENPVDVDIVAVPKPAKKDDLQAFLRGRASKVYQEGMRKFSGRIKGVKTEVVMVRPEEYGAALLTYTGSFGHNIGLRKIAQQKGMLLNEKGLYIRKTGKRIAGETERGIYKKLERPRFKQPWERE